MKSAALHPHEEARLKALLSYEVLDTEDEKVFDELTELASAICGTQISLISLVDRDRQWFKSRVGLDANETPRNVAFCSHAILQENVFEVPNALEDARFADNPLVQGAPDIRFYAGAPLVTSQGLPLGTLCVIDQEPKKLTPDQERALQILAKQVITQLELRIHTRKIERINAQRDSMFAVVAHDLRSPFNGILGLSRILKSKAESLTPQRIMASAEGILASSLKVYQLLDELLQWTKSELGALDIDQDGIPLRAAAEDVIAFSQEAADFKQLAVQLTVDADVRIKADVTLFKTVLRNVLSNAIKYAPEGSTIAIEMARNDNLIELAVQDSGVGVPEHLKATLFQGTVNSMQGTAGEKGQGIGLKLCGDLIQRMGGTIRVADSDVGARIVLSLPLVIPA